MVFLLAYFVVNCIISLFLERKKYRVATVSHVILFTFFLVCLFLSGSVTSVSPFLNKLLGSDAVLMLQKSFLVSNGSWLAPMLVLELVTLLLSVFAGVIAVAKIAEVLSHGNAHLSKTTSTKRYTVVTSADEIVIAKKFMLKCSYLC